MRTLIKNGLLVYEGQAQIGDLFMEDGVIRETGGVISRSCDEVLDAAGRIVIPGGIDPHTHMELQQSEQYRSADDFYTGGVAAAVGGTTTIIDHIGFGPKGCNLHYAIDRYMVKAEPCPIDYAFHGVIQAVDDEILMEMRGLIETEGITSFKAYSTYGFKIEDEGMFRLLETVKAAGGILTCHCENDAVTNLLRRRALSNGHTEAVWHAKTRPVETEAESAGNVMDLARMAGDAPFYIVHTSAGYTLDKVRFARAMGLKNTHVETCTQYLYLTEDQYTAGGNGEGIKYLMSPPLRQRSDVEALWGGIFDGTVETIGTDHCPFMYREKAAGLHDFTLAPGGAPGVTERLRVVYTEGVVKRGLSLPRFVQLTSTNAARLFGLYPKKGTLVPGSDGDIVILNPNKTEILKAAASPSACDYSVYEGYQSACTIDEVFLRGVQVAEGNAFLGKKGDGQFIFRNPQSSSDK